MARRIAALLCGAACAAAYTFQSRRPTPLRRGVARSLFDQYGNPIAAAEPEPGAAEDHEVTLGVAPKPIEATIPRRASRGDRETRT